MTPHFSWELGNMNACSKRYSSCLEECRNSGLYTNNECLYICEQQRGECEEEESGEKQYYHEDNVEVYEYEDVEE
jgi:hypothetical protein